MIKKKDHEVKTEHLENNEVHKVQKKVLIGPKDGSHNIIMRRFSVDSEGYTPHHTHDFEHVVRIEKGKGIIINESGKEVMVSKGDSVFIKSNEKHQFKNPYKKPLEFLCIILNQGSS